MKKGFIAAIAVAILSLMLAVAMGVYMLVANSEKEYKYVLHVGIPETTYTSNNYKNVKEQLDEICDKYVLGDIVYTAVAEGYGSYYDTEGEVTVKETKLVYTFYYANQTLADEVAKEIISSVENSTVLVEKVEHVVNHSRSGAYGEYVKTEE